MMLDFDTIAKLLRARGVVITHPPGEYAVNYLNGKAETAETREHLAEAIAIAEIMANSVPAANARQAAAYIPRRRLSNKPRAVIKRRMKAHNRRLRAKAIREERVGTKTPPGDDELK